MGSILINTATILVVIPMATTNDVTTQQNKSQCPYLLRWWQNCPATI